MCHLAAIVANGVRLIQSNAQSPHLFLRYFTARRYALALSLLSPGVSLSVTLVGLYPDG